VLSGESDDDGEISVRDTNVPGTIHAWRNGANALVGEREYPWRMRLL
jgi:hypothetical protein